MRKESSELRAMPLPEHSLGLDKKTQVADAEETHCEPASSVQKEAERGYDVEHFPQGTEFLRDSRGYRELLLCGTAGSSIMKTIQPISLGARWGAEGGQKEEG